MDTTYDNCNKLVQLNGLSRGVDVHDVIRKGDTVDSSNIVSDFLVKREDLHEMFDDVEFTILHQDVIQT